MNKGLYKLESLSNVFAFFCVQIKNTYGNSISTQASYYYYYILLLLLFLISIEASFIWSIVGRQVLLQV